MEIYDSYDEEPRERFLPLPARVYQEMYDLEMRGFADDLPFYQKHLSTPSTILELGCGSGRLSRLLTSLGHQVTGIDTSLSMLSSAAAQSITENYFCMDMCALGFKVLFDTIIIPYNTINLLSPAAVQSCFASCLEQLSEGGILLMQLQTPTEAMQSMTDDFPSFKFQIFDLGEKGKVVKEILQTYDKESSALTMTERYKIRPMVSGKENHNYSHSLTLNIQPEGYWVSNLEAAGFEIVSTSTTYPGSSSDQNGLMLICAKKVKKATTPRSF